MYHALLFFHILSAFFLRPRHLIFTAFVLGRPVNRATKLVGEILWGVGGLGTLVFGVWLALNRPRVRDLRRLDHRRARPLVPGNGIGRPGRAEGCSRPAMTRP